jgi:hypothetical protein
MAIALIAGGIKGGTANSVTTDAASTSSANLIVLCSSAYNSAPTPTDSEGNTWTGLTARGSTARTKLWYCLSPITSGTHTFSMSQSGTYANLAFAAFSGVNAYGGTETGDGYGTASLQPGSLTPSENGSLIVVGITTEGITTISVNSGFTGYFASGVDGVHMSGGVAYLIQGTAAAVNPTLSWSGSQVAAAAMAYWTPAAGGILRGRLIRG